MKPSLIDRLKEAEHHAGPNGQLLKEAREQLEVSWIGGYRAATETAASVSIRVCPELDTSIKLGVDAVSSILRNNLQRMDRGTSLG